MFHGNTLLPPQQSASQLYTTVNKYVISRLNSHFVIQNNKVYFVQAPVTTHEGSNELANFFNSWTASLKRSMYNVPEVPETPQLFVYDLENSLLLGWIPMNCLLTSFTDSLSGHDQTFFLIRAGKDAGKDIHLIEQEIKTVNGVHKTVTSKSSFFPSPYVRQTPSSISVMSTSGKQLFCAKTQKFFNYDDNLKPEEFCPVFNHSDAIFSLDFRYPNRYKIIKTPLDATSKRETFLIKTKFFISGLHTVPWIILPFVDKVILAFYTLTSDNYAPIQFCSLDMGTYEMTHFNQVLVRNTGINLNRCEYISQDERFMYISTRISGCEKALWKVRIQFDTQPKAGTCSEICGASEKSMKILNPTEEPTSIYTSVSSIECPVCLEVFTEPKIFTTCGHSICHSCEKKIAVVDPLNATKTIFCPFCRKSVVLKVDENLPRNWSLHEVLAQQSLSSPKGTERFPCGECQDTKPAFKLFQCNFCCEKTKIDEILCGDCVTRNHRSHIDSIVEADIASVQLKEELIVELEVLIKSQEELVQCFITSNEELRKRVSLSSRLRSNSKVKEEMDKIREMTDKVKKAENSLFKD